MPRKYSAPSLEQRQKKRSAGPSNLFIRRSMIHAEGCFTKVPIKNGTRVVEYTGPRLTILEADALYENQPRTYLFGLSDGKHVIDGNGVAAFINHSCKPNCEAHEVNGRVIIIAIRDIVAGEELTYDYSLYDGELDDPSSCSCGSKNCRGTMYSDEEIRKRKRCGAFVRNQFAKNSSSQQR
ncbi:MAG: SET domain-containing protein-lysine N-methyltransferase [Acidobacteriaceae bacterium]|nr:SET domain-containing protein-lysine N-methyltransferase [Acidobacteriaceae bacterium]